jgi:hypothetical protein
MRIDHRVYLSDIARASGRLRFSVTAPHCEGELRLMVLDQRGHVQHRMALDPMGSRTPLQLTGFPRGEVFLVCAFSNDQLVWSAPVQAG